MLKHKLLDELSKAAFLSILRTIEGESRVKKRLDVARPQGHRVHVEMVDADLGVTFLPEMARDSTLLRNTRVRLWPIGESSYRTIGLVWRKGSRRVEEFRLLGDFLKENR